MNVQINFNITSAEVDDDDDDDDVDHYDESRRSIRDSTLPAF